MFPSTIFISFLITGITTVNSIFIPPDYPSQGVPSRFHQTGDGRDQPPFYQEKVDHIQGGISGVVDQATNVDDQTIVVDMPEQPYPPPANLYQSPVPYPLEDRRPLHQGPMEPRMYFPPKMDTGPYHQGPMAPPRMYYPPQMEVGPHFPPMENPSNFHLMYLHRPYEWWNGPNVCTDRQEIDEATNDTTSAQYLSYHLTNCVDTESAHICTTRLRAHGFHKTFIISQRCCHGFHRSHSGPGCEKSNLTPVMDTLRSVGGSTFADLIHFSGLEDKFQSENLTVFCPTDDAMKSFQENYENNVIIMEPNVHRRLTGEANDQLVLGHAVSGFLPSEDFIDEKILLTESSGAGIRTNVYRMPNRVVTANCGKVLSINNHATNGIIHVVSRVLAPLTKTIAQVITENPNYSIFKMFLDRTNLLETLQKVDGHFTVLAPTDEAFRQLDPSFLTKLLEGEGCVSSIVKYHILPNVVCREVLPPRARSTTLLGGDVKFRRLDDDRLLVNDILVKDGDQMGTNGVVYPLDGVLLPSQGKPLTAILDEWQLTDLIKLLEDNNLVNKLDAIQNFTFFAPTNEAVRRARSTIEVMGDSPEKIHDMLMYHVAFPSVTVCQADNNQKLRTAVADKSVRFNHFYSMFGMRQQMTIQCAPILPKEEEICKGTVQMIEKVLFPPEGHLIDILSSNQSFSIFRRLLRKAEMENDLIGHGPYTVLAPTDSAFYSLPEEILANILGNQQQAKTIVQNHILPEILCCAGIPHTEWVYNHHESARALNGNSHPLRRTYGGLYVGSARFTACDLMADNGVVHAIGRVLMPENDPRPHRPYRGY